MVHIGISAHQDDIELVDAEVFSLRYRYGQEGGLLYHVSLWKGLGQHIPFEGRAAIGFKIMLLLTLMLLICITLGSTDEAYGCVVWVCMEIPTMPCTRHTMGPSWSGLRGRSRNYNTKEDNLSFQMKLKITITGPKVHDVGYRPWLTEKAVDLALRGFEVYNDADDDRQSVVALVDSDERRATRFFEFAQVELPPLARVDGIRSEPYNEEIQPLWQSATLGTFVQINKAVPILQEMREDLREVKTNTNLIPEIAENTRLIPEIAENTRPIPEIAEKQDVIIDEIRGLHREMTFDAGWRARIESDIQAIKAKIGIR
jgi:acylphosphatase